MRLVTVNDIKPFRALDVTPLIFRNIDGKIGPPVLRDIRVPCRSQHFQRVEIQDKRPAGALASAIDAHHAVYVLRGGAYTDEASGSEAFYQALLNLALGREELA